MTKRMNYTLWTIQWTLALLYLFAGGLKLVVPVAEMAKQMQLPGWFPRFIGVAEVLGALGLILPGLLRIRQELTQLAAVGLAIIMIGATVLMYANGANPAMPLAVGLLAGFVAWGRWTAVNSSGRKKCWLPS
jgi:hypothetical protein